ncbi:hypothetical protein BDZ94DRAFT_1248547 [Collybia nuda]|uniref:F-box domain-containing protein n=1 Tax=Collybia nuda TaxID=64659 RepID=A0A9P5YCM3_9AGAR|nr:hypothetical protein BDZ94DRAFT_1248547 [Collybia nuda]
MSPPMDPVTTQGPKQLPTELWIAIRDLLDPDELRRSMSVHRVFYDHAMDLRYRELELSDQRPSHLFKVIKNLEFPDAANRVRTLTISLLAVQTAIHNVPNLQEKSHSLLREFIKLLRRITSRRRLQTNSQARDREIKERYRTVKKAGYGLTGVENMSLHWHGPDQFDEPLFLAIQPVFSSRLRAVFLDIPLMTFSKACAHLTDLTNLAELELDLNIDPTRGVSKEDLKKAITDDVVPFINRLGPSLQVLSMAIRNHLESAPFFDVLGIFPKLNRLMLNIPFDHHHLENPSGFNHLLVNHPNLKELYITHRSCCMSHQTPLEGDGEKWVQQCFQDVAFTDLKTLSLGLTHAFHLRFMKAMTPLARSLSSLILTEPILHYADVENVLTFLTTPQLSSLTLYVDTLTPQLLVLLAEQRPDLEYLDLKIKQSRKAEGAQGPHDESGFIRGLENDYLFPPRIFNAWKLRRMSIRMWVYTLGYREQPELMKAIIAKVPSLRSSI